MQKTFTFNADAEKAQIQQLFDNAMTEIERNLNNGIRNTYIRIPVQYSSDVKEMIENVLFVGNHPFGWKSYGSHGNGVFISETWNGIREYTLVYYGN